ncbi:MAG: NADH-quinone oxidoreductase subunit NuoK [Corynebacterium sp.]|nr:NADH-quinone oxidoreductase subunit NuoK [Corynebacterium sp.]
MSTGFYLGLAAVLFSIGLLGFLLRRTTLTVLMCAELMLNSAGLGLVAAARQYGNLDGHIGALFVVVVAAAEVVIGLAIVVALWRTSDAVLLDETRELRG